MKKSLMIFSFIFLTAGQLWATEIDAKSTITQVVVYSNRAFVTRTAQVELAPENSKVVLSDIFAEVDENSLKVKGKGTAQVKILGAQLKKEFLEETPVAKVRELQDKIQAVNDENAAIQNAKQVLAGKKRYLDSLQLFSEKQLPEDLVTKMPSAQDLQGTLTFLEAGLKDNFSENFKLDIALRENQKKLEALYKELNEISGPGQKIKRSIVVDVEVAKAGDFDLEVSYLVPGASWRPVYDARTDFEKSEVELVSEGLVQQTTGEDWKDVQMFLSTAQVTAGGRMPEADPWFIRPYQPPVVYPEKKMLYSAARLDKRAVKSEDSLAETMVAQAPVALGSAPREAEVGYAQAESRGVSVVYKLPRLASIKSDGTEHKVPISVQTLDARFEYSSYPRAIPNAYLRSKVANAKDLQLLAGSVNIFLDGDFVGTSSVDHVAPGEEFEFYMGMDENVKVKRELLEKKTDDILIGGIPSPTRKVTYKYKLTAENYKSKSSAIQLFEAIPVSEDDRIKVKVTQVTVEPKDKEWKNKKGIWRWELSLEPKAKQEIFYTYVVECPRDMKIQGLD